MSGPVPNIEFLGRTYDVLAMDPFNLGSTSKVQNVFDWTETDRQSSIGGFSIPKGVTLSAPNVTEYVSETRVVSSSYELQTSAKTDVEVDAGLPGTFEFSASRSVKEMQSSTSTRKWTYGYSRAYRERHIVQLDLLASKPEYKLTKAFRDGVASLPVTDDAAAWDRYSRFIQEFGYSSYNSRDPWWTGNPANAWFSQSVSYIARERRGLQS